MRRVAVLVVLAQCCWLCLVAVLPADAVFKVYIPPYYGTSPEETTPIVMGSLAFLRESLASHPLAELVDSEVDADVIILDFRHFSDLDEDPSQVHFPERTVIIDFRDKWSNLLEHNDALLYYKRSVVHNLSFVKYSREVLSISYCIRPEYENLVADSSNIRDVDVSSFPIRNRNRFRNLVGDSIMEKLRQKYNIHVGQVGSAGPIGRNQVQEGYVKTMLRSRIVVTCNPDQWEGDWRLFESLSSGALVFVDKMLTPTAHPFEHGKHLIYYDRNDLDSMVRDIEYYLEHEDERQAIAQAGREYAMAHHTCEHRMTEVLSEFASRKKDG
jgi:hypothetical protein